MAAPDSVASPPLVPWEELYLDDVSPAAGGYAGQVRTGLLGPVVLRRRTTPR